MADGKRSRVKTKLREFKRYPELTAESESLTCPPLLICLPTGPGSGSEMDKSKGREGGRG